METRNINTNPRRIVTSYNFRRIKFIFQIRGRFSCILFFLERFYANKLSCSTEATIKTNHHIIMI